MVAQFPQRGDIFWVTLDPTVGSEIKKTRPAVIVSNDLQNQYSNLVIIAPITSKIHKIQSYNVPIDLDGKKGMILINQVRAIDKTRLSKQMAMCDPDTICSIDLALKTVFNLK